MADHQTMMRRAIAIAADARRHGNDPFGALLADASGTIVLEAENTARTDNDVTAHAETNLVRAASGRFSRSELAELTLYASCEPCAMCAGAIFFGGIRKVVYGLAGDDLVPMWTLDEAKPALLDLSCREVFAHCAAHPTEVIGPMLQQEALVPHLDFWPERLRGSAKSPR